MYHRMQLLVGDIYWFEEIMFDIALAAIPIRTSDKGEGV
jgi:hypothetical protein